MAAKKAETFTTTMRFSEFDLSLFAAVMGQTGMNDRSTVVRVALREFAARHGVKVNTRTAEMKKFGTKPVRISAGKRRQAGWDL